MKNELSVDARYRHCMRDSRQRWKKQRAVRGFADADTWDLDNYLLQLIPAMLRHLAENAYGYPGYGKYTTFEVWHEELINKAEKFERVLKIEEAMDYDVNEGIEENIRRYDEQKKEMETALHEAFESLEKDFFALWD